MAIDNESRNNNIIILFESIINSISKQVSLLSIEHSNCFEIYANLLYGKSQIDNNNNNHNCNIKTFQYINIDPFQSQHENKTYLNQIISAKHFIELPQCLLIFIQRFKSNSVNNKSQIIFDINLKATKEVALFKDVIFELKGFIIHIIPENCFDTGYYEV